MAADQVVHFHDRVLGHLEAYGPAGGLLQEPSHLICGESQGVAHAVPGDLVVDEGLLGGLGLRAGGLKLLWRVEGVVGVAVLDQSLGVLTVDRLPLALAVGGVGMPGRGSLDDLPVSVHSLVREYPAPPQGLDDVLLGPGDEPVRVRVLDPEDEIPAVPLGVQIVIKRCPDSAHVQRPGRTGREANSCPSFHQSRFNCSLSLA